MPVFRTITFMLIIMIVHHQKTLRLKEANKLILYKTIIRNQDFINKLAILKKVKMQTDIKTYNLKI